MIKRAGKSIEEFFRRMRPHFTPSHRRAFSRLLARGPRILCQGEPIVCCDFDNAAINAANCRYYFSLVRSQWLFPRENF